MAGLSLGFSHSQTTPQPVLPTPGTPTGMFVQHTKRGRWQAWDHDKGYHVQITLLQNRLPQATKHTAQEPAAQVQYCRMCSLPYPANWSSSFAAQLPNANMRTRALCPTLRNMRRATREWKLAPSSCCW